MGWDGLPVWLALIQITTQHQNVWACSVCPFGITLQNMPRLEQQRARSSGEQPSKVTDIAAAIYDGCPSLSTADTQIGPTSARLSRAQHMASGSAVQQQATRCHTAVGQTQHVSRGQHLASRPGGPDRDGYASKPASRAKREGFIDSVLPCSSTQMPCCCSQGPKGRACCVLPWLWWPTSTRRDCLQSCWLPNTCSSKSAGVNSKLTICSNE